MKTERERERKAHIDGLIQTTRRKWRRRRKEVWTDSQNKREMEWGRGARGTERTNEREFTFKL